MTFLKIGPQDQGRKRPFESNGIRYEFEAKDPYGLIHVKTLTSKDHLGGVFTSFKDAEAAAVKHSLTVKKQKEV